MVAVTIRIDLSRIGAIGPGKIRLLELIGETGSISAAGRRMEMSYRRAWLLVEELNRQFRAPIVVTRLGGRAGGGARLTARGWSLVRRYRAIEAETQGIAARYFARLDRAAARPTRKRRRAGP